MNLGTFLNVDFNTVLANLVFALILLIVGVLLGNLAKFILKKIAKKAKISISRGYNFYQLFITVITWSIYILFLNLALIQLDVPLLTNWLTSILVVIPALTGALLLIAAGFIIATYLRRVIEDSKIEGWKILSQIFWYFVLYVFVVFAFKTAFISYDPKTISYLILILSAIVGSAVAFVVAKKRR